MMRMLFWEELERQQMEDARGLLQEQIYREFDVQIGAPRYGRSESRRDERNGHRIRSYEILGGRVGELRIPRAREMEIRFTVLEKWERVQPKVVAALLTAYLLGKSAAAGSMIAEAFGQSRFSRTYLQRLVRQFERRLKQWRERLIKRSWPYIFIDGMVVKVYEAEHLKEKVVIFAYGMDDEHRTELLGWVVADSEEEGAVRSLLIDLRRRGLQTPELFISDAAGGSDPLSSWSIPTCPGSCAASTRYRTSRRTSAAGSTARRSCERRGTSTSWQAHAAMRGGALRPSSDAGCARNRRLCVCSPAASSIRYATSPSPAPCGCH